MRAGKLATGMMWGTLGAVGFGAVGYGFAELLNSGSPASAERLEQCGAAIDALGHRAVVEVVTLPAECGPFEYQFPESTDGSSKLMLMSDQLDRFISVEKPDREDRIQRGFTIASGAIGAVVVGIQGYQHKRWREKVAAVLAEEEARLVEDSKRQAVPEEQD